MASSDEGTERDISASSENEKNRSITIVGKNEDNASFLRAARAGNLEKVLDFVKNNIDINACNANGLNALHLASKEGHSEVVEEVISHGATVDACTKKGNAALHISSLAGQLKVVQILVQHGAKINLQSQNGFTPLYMAAQENHVDVVQYLLENGANQALTTEDGFTPLAVALQQGHDKVVAVLLENDSGGKVHLPALHIAAKKDDVKAANLLLQNDHNADKMSKNRGLVNDVTKSGFTPLHIAAHYGNINVGKLLIDRGGEVNFKARNLITPLHVSSKWGRSNMVALLLDNGGNTDSQTRDGLTPLHCAARSGHHQVVDVLLERGATVTTKTKNGLSPLHMAIQGDHEDCARLLLLHKAPINDVTVDYLTPLHVAAHCGNVKTAKLLLDRKCEVNARALNGFTPLHIACKKNRIKVVELLLKYGATIEATTESGLTPVHVAAFMGHMNIVIFLIQHGANPNFTTVRGETALHLAARANQTDIIRILLRNGAQVDAKAREQQTTLHIASRLGNVDNVLLLLQHGASPDALTKDLSTPLHIAAKEGHDEVVAVLLEHGANNRLCNKKGFSALHIAAKNGHIKVVKLLLEKNADPNVEGRNGLTALHVATHYNHADVAHLLVEKGANPCCTAKNGYTPLHIAAKKNQMDIASSLLEYGCKPNAETHNGFTALHLASQEGHTDMVLLLLENAAEVNCRAKNGLTPMHLAAQEDWVPVAEILYKFGSQIDSPTKAGYTPLHTACHFGQINMIKFLLEHGANINSTTKLGYTALHHGAQQGHVLVINLLLKHSASPNALTSTGQSAMSIAQRLGYISVVEILRPVTDVTVTTSATDEKYKVILPEIMQEAPMSDSEDETGDDMSMLPGRSFQYLASDDKILTDDSVVPVKEDRDLFAFERYDRQFSLSSSLGPSLIHEEMKYMRDDLERSESIHTQIKAEASQQQYCPIWSSQELSRFYSSQEVDNIPSYILPSGFYVSFLVDARGGALRGCRHAGVHIIVPPGKVMMPMRVTCKLVKKEKLLHPPPLMDGEALASRVLEMGPVGSKLLGPLVIEVPHFASLRGEEREIAILRSENGQSWHEHVLPSDFDVQRDALQTQLNDVDNTTEEVQQKRIVRIFTADFPQYFALVTRVRQEVKFLGSNGGVLSSTVIPQVQVVFPPGSLSGDTTLALQAQPVSLEMVSKLFGNRVAFSPLVTIKPRRRKFHKPITLTIPLPKAAQKGMINQYGGDAPNLRLLSNVSGLDTFAYLRGDTGTLDISSSNWKGGTVPLWEDITSSTNFTLVNDCVSFTTSVSARFWLMDCQNVGESVKMASELYKEIISVPFMSKFVVFVKLIDALEARLRIFSMTDDKFEKTLENHEHFEEVARSRDIEVLDGKVHYVEMSGNLVPVTKSGEHLQIEFLAFHENRLPCVVRIRDINQAAQGRLMFVSEPKVARDDLPPAPICNLNIKLPAFETGSDKTSEDRPPVEFLAELRLSDMADSLQTDWVALAEELGFLPNEINSIQADYEYVSEQALVMLHKWAQKKGDKATGNDLEQALKAVGRDDVIITCMRSSKVETDVTRINSDTEKGYLDTNYDPLRDEIGSARDLDSSRGSSMQRGISLDVSYDEHDLYKETESVAEETTSEAGSVVEKEIFDKKHGDLDAFENEVSCNEPSFALDEVIPDNHDTTADDTIISNFDSEQELPHDKTETNLGKSDMDDEWEIVEPISEDMDVPETKKPYFEVCSNYHAAEHLPLPEQDMNAPESKKPYFEVCTNYQAPEHLPLPEQVEVSCDEPLLEQDDIISKTESEQLVEALEDVTTFKQDMDAPESKKPYFEVCSNYQAPEHLPLPEQSEVSDVVCDEPQLEQDDIISKTESEQLDEALEDVTTFEQDMDAPESKKPYFEVCSNYHAPEHLPLPEQVEVSDVVCDEPLLEQDDIISKIESEQLVETLEDGTTIKKRTEITKHSRMETVGSRTIEVAVGTEIIEDILELAPGIVEPYGSDMKVETKLEESEEVMPDGTWEKRKSTKMTVNWIQGTPGDQKIIAHDGVEEEDIVALDSGVRCPEVPHSHEVEEESEKEEEIEEAPVHQEEKRIAVEEEEIIVQSRVKAEEVIIPLDTGVRRPAALQRRSESTESEEEQGELGEGEVPVSQRESRTPVKEEEITRHERDRVEAVRVPMDTGVRHSSRLHSQEEEEESLVSEEELDKSDVPETLEEMRDPVEENEIVKHVATKPENFEISEKLSAMPHVTIGNDFFSDLDKTALSQQSSFGMCALRAPEIAIQGASPLVLSPNHSDDGVDMKFDFDSNAISDQASLSEEQGGAVGQHPSVFGDMEESSEGRISVDTSHQIFIEQQIEAARGSCDNGRGSYNNGQRDLSSSDEFSFVVDGVEEDRAFGSEFHIRPTDLSPLTPTPDQLCGPLPTAIQLIDTSFSPKDQNASGDWNEDGIGDEDGSVSSLSEVAQVEDMEHQPESLKEVEQDEKSADETDIDETFSPATAFDAQRSSPSILSQSPPERISPSKEQALKEEVSPVTEVPPDGRKMKINVGLSPSGFILEEEEEELEEEEEDDEVRDGAQDAEDETNRMFKPILEEPQMEESLNLDSLTSSTSAGELVEIKSDLPVLQSEEISKEEESPVANTVEVEVQSKREIELSISSESECEKFIETDMSEIQERLAASQMKTSWQTEVEVEPNGSKLIYDSDDEITTSDLPRESEDISLSHKSPDWKSLPDVCDFESSIHKSEMQSTMDSGISWKDYPGDTLIETFEEKASALDVEACAPHADDVLGQAVHQDDDEDGDNADSFDFVQAEDLDGYNDYEKLMIASGTYVDGEQLNTQGARMKTDPEGTEGESLAEGSSGEKVQIALTERSIDDQELWENDRANILKEHSSEVAETWESNSKGEFTSQRDRAFVDAEIKSSGQETEGEKESDVNQGTAEDGSESGEPEARPELAEPDDLSESAKPDVRSEPAEPDARSESVEPEEEVESAQSENEPESAEPDVPESAEPEIELKSAEPENEPESAEPEDEPESAEPDKEPESVEPEDEPESAEPDKEPESVEPEDEHESAEPENEPESAEPEDEPESAEPEEEPESVEPEEEPESAEPEEEAESAEPEDEHESAEPEDERESAEPEVKPESAEPDVIHEPAEVEENLESGQSHKVLTPDEGSYELISSIDSDEATRITDSPSNLPHTSATQATDADSEDAEIIETLMASAAKENAVRSGDADDDVPDPGAN